MPSGKVHDRITVVGAVAAAPVWWWLAPQPPHSPTEGLTLVAAILFSGLLLSPDLDLNSSIYHRWGPLRFIWLPYQKAIPHRSPLSHSFLLGPLLRVLYFLFCAWATFRIVTWGLTFVMPLDRNTLSRQYSDAVLHWCQTHPYHTAMCAGGLLIGAALHCGADFIVSGLKRQF